MALGLKDICGSLEKIGEAVDKITSKDSPLLNAINGLTAAINSNGGNAGAGAGISGSISGSIGGSTLNVTLDKSQFAPLIGELSSIRKLLAGKVSADQAKEMANKDNEGGGGKGLKGFGNSIAETANALRTLSEIGIKKAIITKKVIKILSSPVHTVLHWYDDMSKSELLKASIGAKVLGVTGESIFTFTKNMSLVALLAVPALIGIAVGSLLVKGGLWLMELASSDKKDSAEGALALGILGKSLLMFTASLALSAIIAGAMFGLGNMVGGDMTVQSLISTVSVFALAFGTLAIFSMMSKKSPLGKNASEGAKTLLYLSLGLIAFSATFVASKKLIDLAFGDSIDGGDVASMLTTVAVFALAMGTLWVFGKIGGNSGKKAKKGAVSLIFLSLGLLVFSAAFVASAFMIKSVLSTPDGKLDLATAVTTMGVFVLALASVNVFKKAGKSLTHIAKGTLAMLMISAGLFSFGYAFKEIAEPVNKMSWEDLGKVAAVIAGISVEVGIMGAAIAILAPGAAAMLMIGGALLPFSFAVKNIVEALAPNMDKVDGIFGTFENPEQGALFKAIYGMFKAIGSVSLKEIGKAMLAVVPITGMGLALSSLAWGISQWAQLTDGIPVFDKEGKLLYKTPWNPDKIISGVSEVLTFLPNLFMEAGKTFSKKVKLPFGLGEINLPSMEMVTGLIGVAAMGGSLSALAKGIGAFAQLDKMPIYDKDGNPTGEYVSWDPAKITSGIMTLLTFLPDLFVNVGKSFTTDLDLPFGLGSIKVPSAEMVAGLVGVASMGGALTSLADGIMKFAEIEKGGMKDSNNNPIDLKKVVDGVKVLLNTLPKAVSDVSVSDIKHTMTILDYYQGGMMTDGIMDKLIDVQNYLNKIKVVDENKIKGIGSVGEAISKIQTNVGALDYNTFKNTNSIMCDFFGNKSNILNGLANISNTKYGNLEDTYSSILQFVEASPKAIEATKTLTKTLGSFDYGKAQMLKDLFDSMNELSNMSSWKFMKLEKRMEKMVEEIVEAIAENAGTVSSAVDKTTEAVADNKPTTATTEKGSTTKVTPPPASNPNNVAQDVDVHIWLNSTEGNSFTITTN